MNYECALNCNLTTVHLPAYLPGHRPDECKNMAVSNYAIEHSSQLISLMKLERPIALSYKADMGLYVKRRLCDAAGAA